MSSLRGVPVSAKQRKQHLLSRVRGRGGETAVRLLKRVGRRPSSNAYVTVDDSFDDVQTLPATDHVDLDLGEMLNDPKLGPLLQTFAEQDGSITDLHLYQRVSEAMGAEVDDLSTEDVALMPQPQQKHILRLSKTLIGSDGKSNVVASEEPTVMQAAYESASRKVISELLPRFYETDGFKKWLQQQQDDERAELQLLAIMQSPAGFARFSAQLDGQPKLQVLIAAAQINELLATSSLDVPRLGLAQEILNKHFSGPNTLKSLKQEVPENLLRAVHAWSTNVKDDTRRLQALSAFQQVVTIELHSQLTPALSVWLMSSNFADVLEALHDEQHSKTNFVHWFHLPDSFDVMRKWMAERRAAESVDFIADVIKFKRLEDISQTKDSALRICSKYITESSVAQICLPTQLQSQINEGIQMRYPSVNLFDVAVEHVTQFVQQDLWEQFKAEPDYMTAVPKLKLSMTIGNAQSIPVLLSVRGVGLATRHVIHLTKRIITIGGSNCDISTKEFGGMHSAVLRVELAPQAAGAFISVLWSVTPHRIGRGFSGMSSNSSTSTWVSHRLRTSPLIRIRSAVSADSSALDARRVFNERSRNAVMAQYIPHLIKYSTTFLAGDFEAILIPYA